MSDEIIFLEKRIEDFTISLTKLDSSEILLYWFIVDHELKKRLEGGK